MPSPAPCPTPEGCPTPQPCSEVFDAQCVVYTGPDIICDDDTVVNSNDTVAEALENVVDYFCSNSGGGGLQIPELNMYVKNQKLYASLLPGLFSNEYETYNPRIFLFVKRNGRTRKVKDINGNKQTKYYHGGWRHITHMQGINFPNSNFYSGSTSCPTHSEWPLTITDPYDKQELTTFNAGEFYIYDDVLGSPASFGTIIWSILNLDKFRVRGRRADEPTKSVYFRFAIGIDNPDTTSNYPIVFGSLSVPIQCKIVKRNSAINYTLMLQPNGIKHFNH